MEVTFGFMVRWSEEEGGRIKIECPLDPGPIQGPAEADYVSAAISAWRKRLSEYDGPSPK